MRESDPHAVAQAYAFEAQPPDLERLPTEALLGELERRGWQRKEAGTITLSLPHLTLKPSGKSK